MAVNMAVRNRDGGSLYTGRRPVAAIRSWVGRGGSPAMATMHQVVDARADRDVPRLGVHDANGGRSRAWRRVASTISSSWRRTLTALPASKPADS